MKTKHKQLVVMLLALLTMPLCSVAQQPDITLQMPEIAGTLRLGIAQGESSFWLSTAKVKTTTKGDITTHKITDTRIGDGTIVVETKQLKDTRGATLKIVATGIGDDSRLIWAFGGASGEEAIADGEHNNLKPSRCADNVFSVEGRSIAVYYGTSRRLRIVNVLTPPSEIRLSDAHKQSTPLAMYESGKRTDAPALCGATKIANSESLYFAIYKQNPKADYNEFMLKQLHETGSYIIHKDTNWMESTPN